MATDDTAESARHDTHSTVRTVSLGTMWRVLRYPFILLTVAIIPRLMGDTDYGKYAYFMSVFVILDICTDLGFLQIFGRFVPECEASGDHARTRGLFHGILAYGMLLAVALSIGLFVFTRVRPIQSLTTHWLIILVCMLLLTRLEGTFFSFLYGMNHIARFSAKEVLRSGVTLLLVIAFYWRFGLTGALWALVANEVILTAVGAWWTREFLFHPGRGFDARALKPYALFGVTFYIPAFFFGMLQRSGNVFVQSLTQSPEAVAYYDIANQFLLLTATFLGLIIQTLLPALTKLHIRSEQDTIQRWQRVVMTYCAIVAFLAFNALMWLGEPLIRAWLGDSFAPVMPNARIIAAAMIPVLIAYAGMNYALLDKAPGVYTAGVAAGLGMMAVSCIVLVPRMGSAGGAWATVLGYTALGLVFLVHYRARFREVLRHFWVAVAVGLCFLPVYRIEAGLVHSALWFAGTSVLYCAVLIALRVIRWSDAQKIRDAFKRAKSQESEA